MPSIRAFTPPVDTEHDTLVKLQVWVSQNDKRTILSAIGDDGVFTFVIRTQFQRLTHFIRTNDLTSYNPADFTRLVEFVRNGTDTCVNRNAPAQHDTRTASGVQHKDAATKSQPVSTSSSRAPRVRKQTDKGKKQRSD